MQCRARDHSTQLIATFWEVKTQQPTYGWTFFQPSLGHGEYIAAAFVAFIAAAAIFVATLFVVATVAAFVYPDIFAATAGAVFADVVVDASVDNFIVAVVFDAVAVDAMAVLLMLLFLLLLLLLLQLLLMSLLLFCSYCCCFCY